MRVMLVGARVDRERLRSQLDGSMEVVGEFATLAEARAAGEAAGGNIATLLAPGPPRGQSDGFPEADAGVEALTTREIQVLELLAEGLPNKGIARRLGISDQTVKYHVAALSGKLGAANRTDAVRRAVRRGLIAL
jgi:ATP/maltotriose-dependent transcriptional regulator MalT